MEQNNDTSPEAPKKGKGEFRILKRSGNPNAPILGKTLLVFGVPQRPSKPGTESPNPPQNTQPNQGPAKVIPLNGWTDQEFALGEKALTEALKRTPHPEPSEE